MLTSMGAQFKKHINWDDLATSGWKHLFPMQSNLKKFKEIWRFILLIRSLFGRWARWQNLNAVVWGYVKNNYTLCADWSLQEKKEGQHYGITLYLGRVYWADTDILFSQENEFWHFKDLPVWILMCRLKVDLSYNVLPQIGHSLRSLGFPKPALATFCIK